MIENVTMEMTLQAKELGPTAEALASKLNFVREELFGLPLDGESSYFNLSMLAEKFGGNFKQLRAIRKEADTQLRQAYKQLEVAQEI